VGAGSVVSELDDPGEADDQLGLGGGEVGGAGDGQADDGAVRIRGGSDEILQDGCGRVEIERMLHRCCSLMPRAS
jgi:hypothetical protein